MFSFAYAFAKYSVLVSTVAKKTSDYQIQMLLTQCGHVVSNANMT